MSLRGPRLKLFALLLSLVVIGIGIYLVFFQSRGFLKTEAVIVSIEENAGASSEDPDYDVTVRYSVDGKEYTQLLDFYSGSFKVGKTVSIRYNPDDPSQIHGGEGFSIYILAIGIVILAVTVFSWLRGRKAQKALEQARGSVNSVTYAPSVPGPTRQLYFLTDQGTPKYGHRIEDAHRRVLYEAKMTKFTLLTPFGFDFIDHEHGTTTPHLIGHEESSEWDSILIDNHHTFTFDGEFIWQHLKRSGITVESSLDPSNPLKLRYEIFRDGRHIATAVASSIHVHEEDAAQHGSVANAIPAMGFYRITTTETNLDLLFVTLLAFARSDASDAQGGNRKALFNTIKNLRNS